MEQLTFTLLAPEVAGLKESTLRADILNTETGVSLSMCQIEFEQKHTLVVFMFLLSKVRYKNKIPSTTLYLSTSEIAEGIGVNPNSGSVRMSVSKALEELYEMGAIELLSKPKKKGSKYVVVNHVRTPELEEFEKAKAYNHLIKLNPNFVYDETCKFYVPIPDIIISHKSLKYTDKLVYLAILKFSWASSVSKTNGFKPIKLATICEFLNISESSVKRSTNKLEKLGLISKLKKVTKTNDGYSQAVKYIPLIFVARDRETHKLRVIFIDKLSKEEAWEE